MVGIEGAWYGHVQIFDRWWVLHTLLTDLSLPVLDLAKSLMFSALTTPMVTEKDIPVLMAEGIMEKVTVDDFS